ncbi:hypothetical protein QA600_21540 [Natronococcus sp. A-GB1]|uniref:hypothetical protein n=1 Tax=Natronococcus sp. A-GB1 TaxID=3037648 RepID=UPI00241D7461|nr:hypothetical protein [Natronococcus sp. A-GB1]MDG5761908.1 hypothetical protein [Natronococcus sp. A-GB1]
MEDYIEVREDIFEVYEAVNTQPHMQEALRKRSVTTAQDEAIQFGKAAENYDPHKLVLKKINALRTHRTLVTAILLVTIGFLHYTIGSVPEFLITAADWIMLSPHRTGSSLVALIVGLWLLYVLSLKGNRWVTQRMNRELRYYEPTILSCRKEASIRSYRMWNRSLSKPYTLTFLGLVTIGRTISPRAYDGAMNLVKAYLPLFVDYYAAVRLD